MPRCSALTSAPLLTAPHRGRAYRARGSFPAAAATVDASCPEVDVNTPFWKEGCYPGFACSGCQIFHINGQFISIYQVSLNALKEDLGLYLPISKSIVGLDSWSGSHSFTDESGDCASLWVVVQWHLYHSSQDAPPPSVSLILWQQCLKKGTFRFFGEERVSS